MELTDMVYKRRSVRTFLNKKIEEKKLDKIIDAAMHAPTACDLQGWKFIVIYKKDILAKIVDSGAASFIKSAPLCIMVLYDNRTDELEYKDHIQSAAAAIQNMHLMCTKLGLGSCWVCHLPPKRIIRKILKIPDFYDPIAIIPIGYPAAKPKPKNLRYSINDVLSYNYFRFKSLGKSSGLKRKIKIVAKKVYYMMPFRRFIKPVVDYFFEKKFD